jgi:hypothetical protein
MHCSTLCAALLTAVLIFSMAALMRLKLPGQQKYKSLIKLRCDLENCTLSQRIIKDLNLKTTKKQETTNTNTTAINKTFN